MTYEAFMARVEHADAFERLAALDALSMDAAAHTVARAAAQLLADEDPGVREEAARLLATLATEEAARLTVPYIASEDITVRNLAGEVLVQIGAAAVPALAPAIDDAHYDVRKFAIDVLAQLPAQELAPQIAARLHDTDDNVVLAAIDALGDLGAAEHSPALRALYDRNPLARPGIVAALGAFGNDDDLDVLERALADDDPVVQYTAAEALARHDTPAVLDLLLRKIDQVDPMARPVVLRSIVNLAEANPDGAVLPGAVLPGAIRGYLLEMLGDFDLDYSCAAAHGLRAFLDAETADALLAHIGRDDTLDMAMFQTLAAYPHAFGHIVAGVEAGRVAATPAAGFVLGFIAQQCLPEDATGEAGQFLVAHFSTFDADTKIATLGLSQSMLHPAFHAVITTGLADADPEVSAFAADVASALGLDPSQAA